MIGAAPSRFVLPAAAAAAVLVFALTTAVCQWEAVHAIPYWDQWGWIAQYEGFVKDGVSLSGLLEQANEHRLFFPRLIFILDMRWARGTNAFAVAVSDIMQCVTAAAVFWMARPVVRSALGVVAVGSGAALLFNTVQSENLFWGFQVQFIMVYTAAVLAVASAAVAVGRVGRDALWPFLAGCGFATVSTFSMANGVFVWAVLVLLCCVRRRAGLALVTSVAAAVEASIYAYGYHGVASAEHTGLVDALHSPIACSSYLLAYLGAVVAPLDPRLAGIAGAVALSSGTWWVWASRRRFAAPEAWHRFAGGVMLFVLISGAVTAVGRFRFGDIQALSPRYLTPCALLWAVLALAVVGEAGPRLRSGVQRFAAALALASAGLLIGVHDEAIGAAELKAQTAGMGAASDAYVVGVRDDEALAEVTSNQPLAWSLRPFLASRRLGPFADAAAGRLGQSVRALYHGRNFAGCIGEVDAVKAVGTGEDAGLRLDGWAWGGSDGVPSRILLTDADDVVVGLGVTGLERPDVPTVLPAVSSDLSGFQAYARPPAGGALRAYLVSRDGSAACELAAKVVR